MVQSVIRQIGFLDDIKENNATDLLIGMDDFSCTVTIFCNFLITLLTPFYYRTFIKQRKSGAFKQNQAIINQIAYVSIHPCLLCIVKSILFIIKSALNFDYHVSKSPTGMERLTAFFLYIVICICRFLDEWNTILFQYHLMIFESLLNCFIILLAIQRFILIFFSQKLQFLVKPLAIRIYIILIWIFGIFYKCVCLLFFIGYSRGRQHHNTEKLYNKICYWAFGSFVFVTLIYLALFVNLYKMPRINKWNRSEVALLYEGIPLLLTNLFILYYIRYELPEGNLLEFFENYEMRRVIIATALVQFTYIFTFEKIIKFFSTDWRAIAERSSIVAPIPVHVYLQELNNV